MLEYLSRQWWSVALRGAIAVVFGVVALIWPDITLRALVFLYGFYALVDGLLALAALLLGGDLVRDRRGWLIVEGVASFAKSFDDLLDAVEKRRKEAPASTGGPFAPSASRN